jgi:hypothetical protein
MIPANRPYLRSGYQQLRAMLDSSWNDSAQLEMLAMELSHRSSSAEVRLEGAVLDRLDALRDIADVRMDCHGSAKETSLTEEQRDIVQLPWPVKALVTAGPGTGKTHAVVHRVRDLIDRQGLLPGSELLVLSFSRAAVFEIRKRLRAMGGNAAYARAATFDSFATQLLASVEPNGTWSNQSFDDRIISAITLIQNGSQAVNDRLQAIRHVIVDEVQDLVDVRADLVKAVLFASSGGMTLLGDPAQGIYTFQLPESDRYIGGQAIARWARATYGHTLELKPLGQNQRTKTTDAGVASAFGSRLNEDDPEYPEIHRQLSSVVKTLPSVGNVADALGRLPQGKRVAILCRNNGQALMLSRALFQANILHQLQRRAVDRATPRWIADFAHSMPTVVCAKAAAVRQLTEMALGDMPMERAWTTLKYIEGGRSTTSLDLSKVADGLKANRIPDEVIDVPQYPIVVSTIHRAKGLEFDDVFLFESEVWGEATPAAIAEEARVIYVALTRARLRYWKINPPDCRRVRREDDGNGRWFEQGFESWQTFGLEMSPEDVDSVLHPAQKYIRENVSSGDEVTLVRGDYLQQPESSLGCYRIFHQANEIGRTSYSFATVLNRVLRRSRRTATRWPARIDNVRIDTIETTSGLAGGARPSDVGPADIWLKPRIFGMGEFIWE